ncbi:MAG: Rpn family recombination-promoting nuclease/putative transposase [Puniceicoccales bacterium]|jgi:predicted transposase/invertase (TIGR01784 family)|nr:Rpn family recombination-promoting nuclease/putative transposase [Puniceicoccales bacterium]
MPTKAKTKTKAAAKTEALGQYTRFDWSMKRLLRNKADYVVLDGFLTALLGEEIKITALLESEGNKETADSRSNRVDLLAQDSNKRKIIIEIQNNRELDYFQRMLFGTAKVVTDFIEKGQEYGKIGRIFSVNIVYFKLGAGDDYVYRGRTEFRGIHTNDLLALSEEQLKRFIACKEVSEIFPEYYVLRVGFFDKPPANPLDEWLYFLKNDEIPKKFKAPGLKEARERLRVDRLTPAERRAYLNHLDATRHESTIDESIWVEATVTKAVEVTRKMLAKGATHEFISEVTNLSLASIQRISQTPPDKKPQ